MSDRSQRSLQATAVQIIYANLLEKGMFLGLLILLITYSLYVIGILKPYVPINEISQYWSMGVHGYLHHCNIPTGWAWLWMVTYGDFLNFIGIAILAGVTIGCFLAVVPVLWKEGDKVYACFALIEVLILGLAASGILGVGGH
jgi:hypothetical protein